MRFLLPATAVAFALAAPVQARDAVTSFTLDNGLQLVVIEDHRAPVVTQMVWFRTGAADETPGQSGVAHFFEHLMFQGTDDLAPGEFSATVEAQGGNDNAFTSHDYTAYFQRVAADRLDLMMQMEADRMRDLTLSEDDVATELQVIIEERAQRTDSDPGSLLNDVSRAVSEPSLRSPRDRLETRDGGAEPRSGAVVLQGQLCAEQRHCGGVRRCDP